MGSLVGRLCRRSSTTAGEERAGRFSDKGGGRYFRRKNRSGGHSWPSVVATKIVTWVAKSASIIPCDMSFFTWVNFLASFPALQKRHTMFFPWQAVTTSRARLTAHRRSSSGPPTAGCLIITDPLSSDSRSLTLRTSFSMPRHSSLFSLTVSTASLIVMAMSMIISTMPTGSAIQSISLFDG